ncbi:hypothetical protein DIE21_17150 [Burkholderia sp. Bp9140]|uniref:hypothetical protein n=1 Tax=Burkholderia sp. Bp9140 TaxID=2184572 RepID=UPI000F58C997|nr:hypothetical protein [Burkholderia sp. Bp9140]RQR50487.1 hypothetical protein DIE21_17150 [Burkholderia sp. Bp9140]
MTNEEIEQAMPRVVAPGVIECGPYTDRFGSGGYFIAKCLDARREFHWFTDYVEQHDQFLMTRDEALGAALAAVDARRSNSARRAA